MSGHIAVPSDSVTRKKVVYKNRYGLDITGELYHAKDIDLTQAHPALIVGAPYGGVKEQGPCVYGNELAQRGFVVLTFDQSFMGESGGFALSAAQVDTRIQAVATASIDLYDRTDRIPFDKLAEFFRTSLN